MLTAPKDPPNDKDPVSPIKIFAGGALYQRKPKQAPTIDPQNTDASPTLAIQGICKYSEKTVLPTTQHIRVKERATNITGTVAKPSNPSVRLTAFEDPTIIKTAKGIKNKLR